MPSSRMNRDEFFRTVAPLSDADLRKALWALYWRGTADVRARIDAVLVEDAGAAPTRPVEQSVDAGALKAEVDEFVMLARKGAYLAGDRRVSPCERTRWRFTFKRLATQGQEALPGEDYLDAAAALEKLIDLACETRGCDYFRSEDAMEAAGFVVSDAVAALWTSALDRGGFRSFAEYAALQLLRWESQYGWTRFGMGRTAAKETTLADVVTRTVRVADTWEAFAEHYVLALDRADTGRSESRAQQLAHWHRMLLENLEDTPGGALDRIAGHAALGGPNRSSLQRDWPGEEETSSPRESWSRSA